MLTLAAEERVHEADELLFGRDHYHTANVLNWVGQTIECHSYGVALFLFYCLCR